MKYASLLVVALSALSGVVRADDLCRINPYSKAEAEAGKVAFNSHCALCHQYNMSGREPGNSANESPDINTLSASDIQFLDNGGGRVPPLLGTKFFSEQTKKTLAEFSAYVSSAANSFPPTGKVEIPKTYLEIAAYVLYRNCGKM